MFLVSFGFLWSARIDWIDLLNETFVKAEALTFTPPFWSESGYFISQSNPLQESFMDWNVLWFSDTKYSPSMRLNISCNEWHRLLYPLIIKIRLVICFELVLMWTPKVILADSESLCRTEIQWIKSSKIVFHAFFFWSPANLHNM